MSKLSVVNFYKKGIFMNMLKSFFVIALLFGAHAQGMKTAPVKNVVNSTVQDNLSKVIDYAVNSEQPVFATVGKFAIPFGITKYLESDLYGAQKIKNNFFESEAEYKYSKWGLYLMTGAYVLKSQIIKAGVSEELCKNATMFFGLSYVIGKLSSLASNYYAKKSGNAGYSDLLPVSPVKGDLKGEDKTNALKKYNDDTLAKIDGLVNYITSIGAEKHTPINIDALGEKPSDDDLIKFGKGLETQRKSYETYVKQLDTVRKNAIESSKPTGVRYSMIAGAGILSWLTLKNLLTEAAKIVK